MNIAEAALISGINYETIRRHAGWGWARFEGGQISAADLVRYCDWQWKRGRVTMYPPDTICKRLADLRGILYEQ